MRQLLFIFILGLLSFSCKKIEEPSCYTNQTFTLVFKNYELASGEGYIKYLVIGDKAHDVEYHFEKLYFTISVNFKEIYAIRNYQLDSIYMKNTPNACAYYNFFF